MQDTRPEFVKYTPTLPEWLLTGAGLATFFLFFLVLSKFITIVPISELQDMNKEKEPAHEINTEKIGSPVKLNKESQPEIVTI
jgi:hypothetical protein